MLREEHLAPYVDQTTSIVRLKREAVVKSVGQDISPPAATTQARRGARVCHVLQDRLVMGRVKVRGAFRGHLVHVVLVAARPAVEMRCTAVRRLFVATSVPPGRTHLAAQTKRASPAPSVRQARFVRVEACTSLVRQEPSVGPAAARAQPVVLMIDTVVLGRVPAGYVQWDRSHQVALPRNEPPVPFVLVAGHV